MTQLYIGGREVDLSENISISWTYEDSELDTPTAEKNSFSKSVEIEGTPNNNDIFGDYWRLDRNILNSGNSIGVDFDARHRVDFKLVHNADIIESGYVKLDEIKNAGGKITYSVTLFGGLGDFFYGLMYDQNGEERNLADMKYGFDVDNEDKHLCNWDSSFINEGWNKLKGRGGRDLDFSTDTDIDDEHPSYIEVVSGSSNANIFGINVSLSGVNKIAVNYFKSLPALSTTAGNTIFSYVGQWFKCAVSNISLPTQTGLALYMNSSKVYDSNTPNTTYEGNLTLSTGAFNINGENLATFSYPAFTGGYLGFLWKAIAGTRLGRVTLYKNDVVYADFVPVKVDDNVGFYEKISNKYYYPNSGKFKFVKGNDYVSDTDMSVSNWVVACPTYSGTYDDFDNSKVLVNYDSMSGGTSGKTHEVLPQFTGCGPKKGWFIAEATRDLDEWEARDFRSVYQRPAVKTSLIMNAISNPSNNGGYKIEWDKDILKSPYFKDTYVMMNRFDFDNDETANSALNLYCNTDSYGVMYAYNLNKVWTSQYLYDISDNRTFDLSEYTNPNIELNFNIELKNFNTILGGTENLTDNYPYYTSYYQQYHAGKNLEHYWAYTYGGLFVRLECYVGEEKYSESPTFLFTTKTYNSDKAFGYGISDWRNKLGTLLGVDGDSITVIERNIESNATRTRKVFGEDAVVSFELPSSDNVSIRLYGRWAWISSREDAIGGISFQTQDNADKGYMTTTYLSTPFVFKYDDDGSGSMSGIYDGTINPSVQKTNITKNILFGTSSTPYNYLIGFTKMLGAKCECDVAEKKISIKLRKNYYKNEVKNITDKIDRNQDITINPTLTEYKWYLYGFNTPESYAAKIYNSKNKVEYGKLKFDTGYYFNNEVNDLYSDIIFTSAIPYKHSSMYLNRVADSELAYSPYVPSILLSPTFNWTAWDDNGDEQSGTLYGVGRWGSIPVLKDDVEKLCCFDSDNGNVSDITNCFVFFNGFKSCINHTLSDNLKIMSQLNENPCFIAINGEYAYGTLDTTSLTRVCYNIKEYPHFTKYLSDGSMYVDSLDFKKPNSTFIGNKTAYQDGIAIYDRFWKGYINDLYDANSKSVTVRYFLEENPREAMKKFYYLDNCLWRLNAVTDYDCNSKEPTECTFVKVNDIGNYIE